MKVIYLDIDGPLILEDGSHSVETKWGRRLHKMNSRCVEVLNEILDETGAEIIISSDWRLHFKLEIMGEIFAWNGIIKSPYAFTGTDMVSFSNMGWNRIHQIQKSIEEFHPEKWVAVDDLFLGESRRKPSNAAYYEGLVNYVNVDPIDGIAGDGKKQQILNFLT